MADLQLDATGDLSFESGDLVLVTGADAIAQDLQVRLKTFLGEWFLDQRIGVPYFEKILGQKPRLVALKGIFRDAIFTTPGIKNISDFVIDFDGPTRVLSVSFRVESVDGDFPFETELII